jgi:MFS family permease
VSRQPNDLKAVLRVPAYRLYASSRVAATVGSSLLQAVVAWQVYALTGSALDLGLVGLVRFLPSLLVSFVSGAVVDTYDRRLVLMASQATQLLVVGGMLAAILTDNVTLAVIYAMVFVIGVSTAFEGPARQVLLPSLVPRSILPRAFTVNSTLQSFSMVTGPAIGGVLIAWRGVGLAYAVYILLVLVAIALLIPLRVPKAPTSRRVGVSVAAIRDGLAFVWTRPVVLGAMTLDMFAVIFGGAKALLPIYAVDILHADATVYGILTASLEVGALLMAMALVVLPLPEQTGKTLLASVAAFGFATIIFGLSDWLPLSVLSYAAVGAADQVSMVMRQNTIQLATPDELRGRVTAVNSVFISASNQLGAVESGLVAAATNAVFAVVSGGIACLGVVAVITWRVPELRRYRATDAPI